MEMNFEYSIHESIRKVAIALFVGSSLNLLTMVDGHSYLACADWVVHKGVSLESPSAWSDNNGLCNGYARRFKTSAAFGTLDSDAFPRIYQQKNVVDPDACSNGVNSAQGGLRPNAQKGKPISSAYKGLNNWGRMTSKKAGSKLCMRWPPKNHDGEYYAKDYIVNIRMIRSPKEVVNGTQKMFGNPIAHMPFASCENSTDIENKRCGGCFTLPQHVTKGIWSLQWSWRLNDNNIYADCADINVL